LGSTILFLWLLWLLDAQLVVQKGRHVKQPVELARPDANRGDWETRARVAQSFVRNAKNASRLARVKQNDVWKKLLQVL
jgi:hypothetical protein